MLERHTCEVLARRNSANMSTSKNLLRVSKSLHLLLTSQAATLRRGTDGRTRSLGITAAISKQMAGVRGRSSLPSPGHPALALITGPSLRTVVSADGDPA